MTTGQRYLVLGAIALAARFALIVPMVLYHDDSGLRGIHGDTPEYVWPAVSLVRLGMFRERPDPSAPPMHFRTPGYPLFLAAHYSVFGLHLAPPLITQGALGAIGVLAIYTVVRRWLEDEQRAFAVGVLACVAPCSVVASAMVLSDHLSYVTFAVGLLAFTEGIRRQRWWLLALAGGTWGFSCLAHPRLLLFPPAMVLLGWLTARHLGRRLPRWGLAAAVALFCVFPVGWSLRNYRQLGLFHVAVTGNYNLKYHLAVDVATGSDWRESKKLRAEWRAEDDKLLAQGWTIPELDRKRLRDAVAIFRSRPFDTAWAYVRNALYYLATTALDTDVLFPLEGQLQEVRWRILMWSGRVGALIGLIGAAALWRRDRALCMTLLVLLGYFAAVAGIGSRQTGRMVLQAEPAYLVFFASGCGALWRAARWATRRGRRARAAGGD